MIGIDEAGYGPNLGPLCVAATAWRVEPRAERRRKKGEGERAGVAVAAPRDLYAALADVVSATPDGNRITIADSKLLYKPVSRAKNCGLRHLERGVLTALGVCGKPAADLQELLRPPPVPWYADYNCRLPIDTAQTELAALANRFLEASAAAATELVDLHTRLVFPEEFNQLVTHHGTKGAALSHVSIELVKSLLTHLPDLYPPTRVSITFDKHGGRNHYGALLQHHFPEHWIETVEEGRARSQYRWGDGESRVDVVFRTKGEAELPVALASMTAKYHRELAMRAFNAFWTQRVSGLRPTAGYPQDAKRFKAEIAAVQYELGIADQWLWRTR